MNRTIRIVDGLGRDYTLAGVEELQRYFHEGRLDQDVRIIDAQTEEELFLGDLLGADKREYLPLAEFCGSRVKVVVGDLTRQAVDAIVNAANSSLMGGGGVDGAIHDAGGPRILEECKQIRKNLPDGLPTGEVAITTAGNMPARHVIHTVGPVYHALPEEQAGQLLGACYRNALQLAAEHGLESIAVPAISTGIYGFPPEKAAPIVGAAIQAMLDQPSTLHEIRLVFRHMRDAHTFLEHQSYLR